MAYTTNKLTVKKSGDNPAIEIDGDIKQVGFGTIKIAGITIDNATNKIDIPATLTAQRIATGTITAANTDDIPMIASGTPTGKQVGPYKGKTYFVSGDYAFNIVLSTVGAFPGDWVRFILVGTDTCAPTFKISPDDQLIIINDNAAKSFTFKTGHRIGSSVLFIFAGPKWVAIPSGTVTTDFSITA